MDLFDDDILPAAPAARARPGGKFAPKVKSKQPPRKEKSASEHATLPTSKDSEGISQNEHHNAVAGHPSQAEVQNLEGATNSKMGNPQQVGVNRDTSPLVDDLPITTAASGVVADQNFTNFPKSASKKADSVGFEVGSVAKSIPEIDLNNVHPASAVENELNNEAAPSTTCPTISRMEEPPKNGEGSFLDSNKSLEVIDNSLQVSPKVDFKSASNKNNAAITESNIHSSFDFGKEREVLSAEFELDPFSNILLDPGTRKAHKFQPKIKPRPKLGNTPAIASSSVLMEKSVELPTCTNEVQPFHFSGDVSGGANQSTGLPLPTSEILRTTDLSNKFDYMNLSIPFSEDNRSLAAAIPSQPDSLNAIPSEALAHNGTRDWPSSIGKSAAETADIFSGLDLLDDFVTQAATGTGKPVLNSFNEKGTQENFAIPAGSSIKSFGVCDTTQAQRCPEYLTTQDSLTFNEAGVVNEDDSRANNSGSKTQEVTALNHDCPVDIFDYQYLKSGTDPTSEIPMHEELTTSADSPTLADFLHQDVTGEKEEANERKNSPRKHKRSSITGVEDGGKTSRQLRKQAARKPANIPLNEDVVDDDVHDPPYNSNRDELEENDDEYGVDYLSKKKRAPTSSKKKSVTKTGKTSQKRKKANGDSEKNTKEPPKKFSHSTRRKKRCVDKALLEDDELEYRTLPIRDIILLADYKERLAKKEATTSKISSTNQSGGDFPHEAGANNEEEIFGSEDGRDPDDDQASERITSTTSLFNYQSFMDKAPRGKWSKQDTELFYEAVKQFGADFSMIQQLFPGKTRHQVKLKYKKEERQHPLQINDALNNRATDHFHYKSVIEKLQQASTKAEQDPSRDASDFMPGEEEAGVEDLTPGTNKEAATAMQEDVATAEQEEANVKDQQDSVAFHSPEQSDDSDDELQRWSQFKTDF